MSNINFFRIMQKGDPQLEFPPDPYECSSDINPPTGYKGLYNLTFDAGSSIGAVVVYFNPQGIPDGIRAIYNNVYYNAVSSPSTGRIQTTSGVTGAFTILGSNTGCLPSLPSTSTYDYYNGFTGSTWDLGSPPSQSITINSGDDQYGGNSQYNTLVIPKSTASPSTVIIQVLGPCTNTAWYLEVDCPVALPSFTSSPSQAGTVCNSSRTETFYYVKHRGGVNTGPKVTSWVFTDSSGANYLPDGNYNVSTNDVITVSSGVVTAVNTCT
jgi:hypothetical protein